MAAQTVRSAHARSDVGVMLVEIYCEEVQLVAVAHSRLDVDVGALVWYSLAVLQEVMSLQTRSDVVVSPVASN